MGVSNDTDTNADLHAIYQGGDNFLARMKALTDQKSAIEKMLVELNLGRDARVAYDDAAKLQEQARSDLAHAKNESARILSAANQTAAKTLNEAREQSSVMLTEATAKHKDADDLRKSAADHHKNASDISLNMDNLKNEAVSARDSARNTEERFKRMIELLRNAMSETAKL